MRRKPAHAFKRLFKRAVKQFSLYKKRGLSDDVSVVAWGEFGRTPVINKNAGRDHNQNAMCSWLAGGGIKGGIAYGATDDLGFAAADQRVSVPDFHATILHLLGLDYHKLAYHRNGLEERLTGVAKANVVKGILA